ncbi:MAG: dihydroorotase [Deltaproteobacteria bacterium]|nr:dihydroorotase [Deltaproteobacteria bacterium]
MLLIKNGRVIDPSDDIDDHLDILVDQGKIVKLRRGGDREEKESEVVQIIDARGKVVVPGLIDMHVHLREPGYEYKETIKTGCQAAASGGFTSIACMPNTSPINDNQSVTEYILDKAKREGCVNVFPVGAITKGLEGEFLAEMGELRNTGVVAVSDDGKSVINGELMRRGMEYARNFNLLVICHCENPDLVAGGVMNEGFTSTRLGLKGIPNAAEETIVARDIILAEMTGCRVHIAHVSTEGAVRIIREAKSRGVNVTAETAPHYFSLSEEALESFDTNFKVNPPLRSARDVEAVKEGLKDGTLDVIATDHAPHSSLEKDVEFDYASSGLVGLETALPLALQLVKEEVLSLSELIAKFTVNPAKILNISKGRLNPGNDADITIIDVSLKNRVDVNQFKSRSRNSPFHGWELEGGAVFTIVKGKVIKDANGLVV